MKIEDKTEILKYEEWLDEAKSSAFFGGHLNWPSAEEWKRMRYEENWNQIDWTQ